MCNNSGLPSTQREYIHPLSYVFTPVFWVAFAAVMTMMQPVQIIARLVSPKMHERSMQLLNMLVLVALRSGGIRLHKSTSASIDPNRPVIFLVNHQSMFDIPIVTRAFPQRHVKFVAKSELGRGVPSVSYALRHGGHLMIERDDPRAAIKALKEFGRTVEENNLAVAIFPEGTRARDGRIRPFKPAGVKALIESVPSAQLVPVAIRGSWEIVKYKLKLVPFGTKVGITALPPIQRTGKDLREIINEAEAVITSFLSEEEQSQVNTTK